MLVKNQGLDYESGKFSQLREVISVRDWLRDFYYVGPVARDVYDFWADVIIECVETSRNEVILTGALGTGKSYAALVLILRKLYELSCFCPIPNYLGLGGTSLILFLYLSISVRQAKMTGFGELLRMVEKAPYFRECYPWNENKVSEIEFSSQELLVTSGSDVSHIKGGNLFALVLDESNFRQGNAELKFQKAMDIYTETVNRRASRFLDLGVDLSFSAIVSSTDTKTSFTESRMEAAQDDDNIMVVHSTTWQTKPKKYKGEMFWVFKGNERMDPFLLEDELALKAYFSNIGVDYCEIGDLPRECKRDWIQVPVELKKQFELDLVKALADVCGVALGNINRLFTNIEAYNIAFPETSRYEHPITKEELVISYRTAPRVEDYIRPEWKGFNRKYIHYAHIDQSLSTDRTGLAISHAEYGSAGYYIKVDLKLAVVAPPRPDQIGIRKLREFLFWLIQHKNLVLGKVTYDMFASAESIQETNSQGVESCLLSVDRDSTQYDMLVSLLLTERIKGYHFPIFKKELFKLEKDTRRRKVDHPKGGSKDVSDAVAGSVWNTFIESGVTYDPRVRFI